MLNVAEISKTLKWRAATFITILLLLSLIQVSHAQVCNPPQTIFEKIGNTLPSFDIRRTGNNIPTTFIVDFLISNAGGVTYDQMMGCGSYLQSIGVAVPPEIAACTGTDTSICDSFLNLYSLEGDPLGKFASGQSAGSLLGMVYSTQDAAFNEPLPVNLAFYANHYANKVPFANTALAQTQYNQPFLGAVLGIWTLFRNIAYAIVAIVLIIVGFMIMTRKRISQQAVVTVQYAIPKIVVALILITFSYPIAAVLMTVARVVSLNMPTIMQSIGSTAPVLATSSIAVVLMLIIAAILGTAGIGLALLLIATIFFVAVLVLGLMVQLKILLVYLRMLFSLVTAPLEFAIGAIPGTEDKIVAWFKRMVAYALSIVALAAGYHLVLIIGSTIITTQLTSGDPTRVVGGALLAAFGSPFIVLFGFFFTLQLPGKIEAAIIGAPKRK